MSGRDVQPTGRDLPFVKKLCVAHGEKLSWRLERGALLMSRCAKKAQKKGEESWSQI